jgi:hypothetical protein
MNYPPILEVPVSESARNLKEISVTLLFDTPKEIEGKFGTQFKYGVEVGGVEHTLFASNALHRKIQDCSPAKGSVLSIARFGTGKETKWDVVLAGGPGGSKMVEKAPQSSAQGVVPRGTPQTFVDHLQRYWEAFDLAHETLKEKGLKPSVDVNAIAFVIYKLAIDNNVVNLRQPLEPQPTTTETAETEGKNKMLDQIRAAFTRTKLAEEHWLTAVNMHNDDAPYTSIEQMPREVGLAVWATIKNVENGVLTWNDFLFPEELPF